MDAFSEARLLGEYTHNAKEVCGDLVISHRWYDEVALFLYLLHKNHEDEIEELGHALSQIIRCDDCQCCQASLLLKDVNPALQESLRSAKRVLRHIDHATARNSGWRRFAKVMRLKHHCHTVGHLDDLTIH